MMKLRRGPLVVLGLTAKNLDELRAGRVIQVRGEDIDAPGLMLQLIYAETHEEMRAMLRAGGYDVPAEGNGDGDGDGDGDGGHGRGRAANGD